MKVIESNHYNKEFPETFTWRNVDSISLCAVADDIRLNIEHDLKTQDRNLTPGLRLALNIIAEWADI